MGKTTLPWARIARARVESAAGSVWSASEKIKSSPTARASCSLSIKAAWTWRFQGQRPSMAMLSSSMVMSTTSAWAGRLINDRARS